MSGSAGQLYIGPSGWSYPDWEGVVYPTLPGRRMDQLRYISGFFHAVEVNSSFYRPPSPQTTASWARRAQQPFRFAFKLHQRFTHQRDEPPDKTEVEQFTAGLLPVEQAGLLGPVLVQFPWSFRCGPSAFDWLARLAGSFGRFSLVVEVRHSSWDVPEARANLQQMGLNYCNIDQPPLRNCIGPSAHATGPIGYVRLHGRRADTWFRENIQPHERYDYLYAADELAEWVGRIRQLAQKTERVFVFANNHYAGQGPANALQLRAMLEGTRLEVPPAMLERFGFLRAIARQPTEPPPKQRTLFD